jgi:hypothetical protein
VTESGFHRLNGKIAKTDFFSLNTGLQNGAKTAAKTVENRRKTVISTVFVGAPSRFPSDRVSKCASL